MQHGSAATRSLYSDGPLLKNALMSAFRPEVTARAAELLGGVLKEDNVNKLLEAALAKFDRQAWMETSGKSCDLDMRITMARTWLKARYAYLASGPK